LNNVLDSYDDLTYTTQDSKNGYTDTMKNYALGADVFLRQKLSPKLLLKSALRFRYDHNRRQRDLGDEWENYSMNTLSIPVEVEWRSGKIVDFTVGTSLDFLIFDKGLQEGNKTTLAFNPQAGLIIKASNNLDFKLTVSAKTRFPTMKELFSSISGNPDLRPMKANIFEAGFRYTWKTGQVFSFTAFYNDLDDLISRKNKTTPYLNIEKALFAGFETGFELPITRRIICDIFYTYLHAKDKSSGDQMAIEHRPKHKLDASLQLILPADFSLNVNVSLVSSQYYYDDERKELDPYNLLDLKLSKRIAEKVTLNLTVHNLFDVDYYESVGYPREGRMVLGGVQVDL
jgi:outer membrane cobalamin receptor